MAGYLAFGQCHPTVSAAMSYMARVHNKFLTATTGQMQLGGTTGVDYTLLTAPGPIEVPVTWTPFGQTAQRVNSTVFLQPCEFTAMRLPGVDQAAYQSVFDAASFVLLFAAAWWSIRRAF